MKIEEREREREMICVVIAVGRFESVDLILKGEMGLVFVILVPDLLLL